MELREGDNERAQMEAEAGAGDEGRELQAAVCEGCGGYRLSLLPPGGGVREVFATDPDPMPENCRSAQKPAKQANLGIFGADRRKPTSVEAF